MKTSSKKQAFPQGHWTLEHARSQFTSISKFVAYVRKYSKIQHFFAEVILESREQRKAFDKSNLLFPRLSLSLFFLLSSFSSSSPFSSSSSLSLSASFSVSLSLSLFLCLSSLSLYLSFLFLFLLLHLQQKTRGAEGHAINMLNPAHYKYYKYYKY